MINDPVLLNDWHPVVSLAQLNEKPVLGARLLGEDIVVWRCGAGVNDVLAWQDLCIHRGTRLSLGKAQGDTLACPYHGCASGRAQPCPTAICERNRQECLWAGG